jgi:SAM-dependent methyltransferase
MGSGVNAAQAERWNGDSGRHWIVHRERHAAGHERLIPHLLRAAGISPGDRVLDVGCGCGETTIAAARAAGDPAAAHPDGSALGLDLSAPMLEIARRLAAEAGITNIGFAQGDAQVYPLPPGFYDVVVSSFGVMFFDDPAAAFGNIVGALRPGGRLAFLCWQDDAHNELFAIPLRALARQAGQPVPADDDMFTDPRQVTDLLSGAGCTDIQVDAVTEPAWLGTDVADVMAYVRDMRRVRTLTAELGDEALAERALATMADEYATRQRPDGVWVDAAAWVVSARRG